MSSKKEEQRRIREEKQEQAVRKQHLAGVVWKVAVVILIPLVAFALYQGLRTSAAVRSPIEITAEDHVRGTDTAPVTLTVYGDFQCPACMEEAQVIARAWNQIDDKARLVFRHYPLDTHQHAFEAARYAEAAARQDRFWEMHDVLYANQQLWSSTEDPEEVLDGYASALGLDMDQLKTDLVSSATRDKILTDQRGGTRAGVRSTPSLFVNGKLVSNPRAASDLISLVNRAAEAAAAE
jgi:protein-disulfide isomerase